MKDLPTWLQEMMPLITEYGVKVVGAFALWLFGSWLINGAMRMFNKAAKRLDSTVHSYLEGALRLLLRIALIVAVLGYFGFETTTFAALLAGVGLAVGTAWGGLLSNLAAGVFIMMLRPYRVGDFVSAAGMRGTVVEVGLFTTTINTLDNVRTILGNTKVFNDTIQNFTANDFRRIDLTCPLDHSADVDDAIERLRDKILNIPQVDPVLGVDIGVLELAVTGPVLAVRPFITDTKQYWPVYFATNKAILEVREEASLRAPTQHFTMAAAG